MRERSEAAGDPRLRIRHETLHQLLELLPRILVVAAFRQGIGVERRRSDRKKLRADINESPERELLLFQGRAVLRIAWKSVRASRRLVFAA